MKKNLIPAGLVALMLLLTGCSIVFMKEPSDNFAAGSETECTASNIAPVADTIIAVTVGILSLATYISSTNPDPDTWLDFSDLERATAGVMIIPMVMHGLSATYGYVTAYKCRRSKTGYEVALSPVPFNE